MVNEVIKKYVEEKNNFDTNYKSIYSKIENKKHMNTWKKKVINSVAIIVAIIGLVTASNQIYAKIQWNVQFKEYQNREYKYGVGQKNLTETVDMEYVEQDGIKVKVDSLMTTDDHFEAKINFEFAEDIKLNSETFEFGYAIYDEENNLYGIFGNMNNKTQKRGCHNHFFWQQLFVQF